MGTDEGTSHTRPVTLPKDISDAIKRHLTDAKPVNGIKYQSSLTAILGDARGAANRDERGRVKPGHTSQSWLAATGYLIMLDQVGKTFSIDGRPDRFNNPVGNAIDHFSPVRDAGTIEALWGLRNALAHDYSLFNKNPNGPKPGREHAFNFTADTASPLVEFPAVPWNRVYKQPAADQVTVVNLRKVGDLAETVFSSVCNSFRRGTLRLRMSLDEFEWRYGMQYRVPRSAGQ
jgi:hypothetical protein